MENQKFLRYTINGDTYTFFYGEEILFYNNKSNPFIYITLEKEGVKKQLPLYYCDIIQTNKYGYKLKFHNKNCEINFKVTAAKNNVYFEFIKLGFFEEKISINLYRKNSKIKGMGLNQYKDIRNTICDKNEFSGKKEYYDIKPAFSIKNGYFFKITNIEDYQLSFYGSSIKLDTKQNVGQFYLEFEKQYYFGDKTENRIRVCDEKELEKEIIKGSDYNGFILQYKNTDEFLKIVQKARKKGYKIYIYLCPIISKKDPEFSKYKIEGLLQYKEDYIIEDGCEENKRLFNNKIREIYDHNIDGLYIDEKNIKYISIDDEKNPYIGSFLHNTLYKINKEYTKKTILYNKLYLDEKNNEIFCVKYNDIKKKESDYKKSLTYSAIDTIFYEYTEKEYKKGDIKNKQIIVW